MTKTGYIWLQFYWVINLKNNKELSFMEMGTKLIERGPSAKNLNVKQLREIGKKIIKDFEKTK